MTMDEKKLEVVVDGIQEQNPDFGEHVLNVVVHTAAQYFAECPRDFSVQNSQGETITFGGSNRLYWHPVRGFDTSDEHSSLEFVKRFNAIKSGEIKLDMW